MSKIIGVEWRSSMAKAIGIVATIDEVTKEIRFYIGVGEGFNEQADAEYIAKLGARLNENEARGFFPASLFREWGIENK